MCDACSGFLKITPSLSDNFQIMPYSDAPPGEYSAWVLMKNPVYYWPPLIDE
jgi:hypothetical protein